MTNKFQPDDLVCALAYEAQSLTHHLEFVRWMQQHVPQWYDCIEDYVTACKALDLACEPQCTIEGDPEDGTVFVEVTATTREPMDKNEFMHKTHSAIREKHGGKVTNRVVLRIDVLYVDINQKESEQ